jgi:hypothetical protein
MRITKLNNVGLAALAACALTLWSSAAAASSYEDRSLQDTVRASDLIIVGEITEIDETEGMKSGGTEALTRVSVQIDRVLRGDRKPGEAFEIIHRGGLRSDGMGVRWSARPTLNVGDRYLLCLRAAFRVMPFVDGSMALLRVATIDGADVAVDPAGRAVIASATLGLMLGAKVAAGVDERRAKRAAGEVMLRAETAQAKVPTNATADRVFDLFSQLARDAGPPAKRMASRTMPEPRPMQPVSAGGSK